MSRIQTVFQRLQADGRKALIPFVTAGFPTPELTLPLMHALVDGGADIIELGVPFSDPMADGPVIQKAAERALAQGISLNHVLDDVRAFRASNATTPMVGASGTLPGEPEARPSSATQIEPAAAAGAMICRPDSKKGCEKSMATRTISPGHTRTVSLKPTTLSTTLGGVRLTRRKTPPIAPWANSPTRCAFDRLRRTKAMPAIDTRQTRPAMMMMMSLSSMAAASSCQ